MKILDIAVKDITRSFRSYFALMFMFGVPLLMGGMFYLMFGSRGNSGGFSIPVTHVVVANLDAGGPGFEAVKQQFSSAPDAHSMGELLLSTLQNEQFADLMSVSAAESAETARAAVDSQKAGVAVIIPSDFSERFSDLSGQAAVEVYSDPTLTLGPSIVKSVLSQFLDGVSGAKIAVQVVMKQTGAADPNEIGAAIQKYLAVSSARGGAPSLIDARAPAAVPTPENPIAAIVGMIMAGMSVFYAFFTGASSAQSILKEDEEGTLARLFVTPTPLSTVLGGKILAVGLTVIIQMCVLLLVSTVIFGIHWGDPLPVALAVIGTVAAAASFGIFLMSLMKNHRQASAAIGTVLTATGMLGMIKIFTFGSTSVGTMEKLSLFVPQGWAVRGLLEAMNGGGAGSVAATLAVLLAASVILFAAGVVRFQKRYA
jgi:ABC-2 type transport system permease protein